LRRRQVTHKRLRQPYGALLQARLVRPLPACLVPLLLLSGCAGPDADMRDGDAPCPDAAAGTMLTFNDWMEGADPTQPLDALAVGWGYATPNRAARWNGTPPGDAAGKEEVQPASLTTFSNGSTPGVLHAFRFDARGGSPPDMAYRFGLEQAWGEGACEQATPLQKAGNVPYLAGPTVAVGSGALVRTAGFWENGTLFYTNIASVHASGVPRASWYAWGGDEPLRVYVYDQARTEQPPQWRGARSNLVVAGQQTGVAPPQDALAIAGDVDSEAGAGYSTTIQGFNEALKGLSTTATRVVRLAPEEAYTLPGNEAHPLYGDAIVFYIDIVEAVAAPCPGATAEACATP
jgi:hypothetical protein